MRVRSGCRRALLPTSRIVDDVAKRLLLTLTTATIRILFLGMVTGPRGELDFIRRSNMTQKIVVIADDDHDLVDVLTVRCRRLGVTVIAAHDCRSALTEIRRQRPDLACVDIDMASGRGLDVCKMLHDDEELTAMPVVVLTGDCSGETIERCESMGAHYVFKSGGVWQSLRPVLCRLLNLTAAESDLPDETDRDFLASEQHQGLSRLIEVIAGKDSATD